jgi:hypothetical protein
MGKAWMKLEKNIFFNAKGTPKGGCRDVALQTHTSKTEI